MEFRFTVAAAATLMFAAPVFCQISAPAGAGKNTATTPVEMKRVRPQRSEKAVPREAVPTVDHYPFGRLIGELEGMGPPQSAGPRADAAPGSEVPKDWPMPKDVPLSPTAREALNVSQPWMTEKQVPAPGKDGRVLYTFGAGLPTVVCAPLRVCVLELQPGEKLVGEPHIGDSVRWSIAPASAGRPDFSTSMIVIKPKQAGLDTNLLVTTDRRAYYVRLISKPEEYLARVAFSYPDDDESKWKAHLAQQEQLRKEELESSRIEPIETMDKLYFDYRVTGGDENMRPVRVVDDGKKTFIQMPAGTAVREAPVLVVLGPEGKPEMVNYRVKGDLYIVDRLFERGALLLGVGKKQRRADIIRGTYRSRNKKADSKELSRSLDQSQSVNKN
ncbi:MAG: P-type conjugative transfer protein TrbG [Bryobacterales bacterium]|nr:P-type conjugative transfer protein TrbG [Bryobacterales bacterium]